MQLYKKYLKYMTKNESKGQKKKKKMIMETNQKKAVINIRKSNL